MSPKDEKAVKNAIYIYKLGHKDMIDNLLYSYALRRGYIFLSMDKLLKEFLKSKGYESAFIVDHRELLKIFL